MRKRSCRLVVTVSALAGCTPSGGNHRSPEPERTAASTDLTAPTPPTPATAADDATSAPDANAVQVKTPTPLRLKDYPKLMNAKDAAGRAVHRAWQGAGCYVELPFPPLKAGEQRPPGTEPPTKKMPCPKSMADPVYEQCRGGTISQNDAGDTCICFVMGNPPPLPKAVACPGAPAKSGKRNENGP